MAITKLPANTPALFKAAGLTVIELDGWENRGRPASTGGLAAEGVMWHHTGGAGNDLAYARWMAVTGRPADGLPAPLCQLAVDRQGRVYILAAGRANHAGKARASGTMAAGDGNRLYIGVECMNTGSEGWSKAQYAAMVTLGRVLAEMIGNSVETQRAHRETSITGKWDPGMLDMPKFRADIKKALDAEQAKPVAKKPAPKPAPKGDRNQSLRRAILAAEKATLKAAEEARKVGRVPLAKRFEHRAKVWKKRRISLRVKP